MFEQASEKNHRRGRKERGRRRGKEGRKRQEGREIYWKTF